MKIDGNDIRIGYVIENKNRRWMVTQTEHVKPGKGGAYMQVEMKDILTGTKTNERFRSSESVERVYMEDKPFQYLFTDGNNYTFMDQETFEQIELPQSKIGEASAYLGEGMVVTISLCEEEPLFIKLPDSITLEVVEADAVVKGQTATSSFKPAVLSNGIRIMVPQYITAGTKVVVNPTDSTYIERAKG